MGTDDLNVRGIIEGSSRRTTVSDLQRRGINRVRLIDEKQIHELILRAVQGIVAERGHLLSETERDRLVKAARVELGRLVKEQEEMKDRAAQDRASLEAEVTNLQRQLLVTRELAQQEAHQKYGHLIEALKKELAESRGQIDSGHLALQQEIARRLDAVEARLEGPRPSGDLEGLKESLGGIAKKLDSIRAKVSPNDLNYRPGSVTLGDLMDQKVESNIDAIGVDRTSKRGIDEAMKRLRGLRGPKS